MTLFFRQENLAAMAKLTLKERLEQKKKERAYLKKLEEQDGVDGYDIRKSVDRKGVGNTKIRHFSENLFI